MLAHRLLQLLQTRFDRERIRAFFEFTWHRFVEDRCLQTAGALSFTSVFALVPLTAAVLGILAAFPGFADWRAQLTRWVFQNFVPAAGTAVEGYVTQFADNASKATVVGVLVLLFSSISLMMSIEDAFNRIWRVPVARKAGARFVVYWAALTLGPLLLVGALALSSYAFALPFIDAAEAQFSIKARVLAVLPFLLVWSALVAGYAVIPNRSVRLRDALIGAFFATVLFELAKRGFALYATRASYQQVYGAIAIVPIFIFWIYLSWAIVLFGASLTASMTSFDYRPASARLPRGQELVGLLRVIGRFIDAHRAGRGLHSSDLSASEAFLTDDLLQRYLGDLHRVGLIRRGELGDWLVARDPATVRLVEVVEEGAYRLPLGAFGASAGLAEAPRRLLDELGLHARETLGLTLAALFAGALPSTPSAAANAPSSTMESA